MEAAVLDGPSAHTPPNNTTDVWLTTQGCARRGNCCDATVRRAIKSGELEARVIGARYRIHVARFDAWLEQQAAPRVLSGDEREALTERNRKAARARWDRRPA